MLPTLTHNGFIQKVETLISNLTTDNIKVSVLIIIMAKQKDGEALYRIGKLYYDKQTRQDYLKALEWFQLSCYQDYADAFCMIGQILQYGKGMLVNHEMAMNYYLHAASLESSKAKFQLGCMFHYGIGFPSSYSDAFQWYSKAAHQNNADAQNSLGYLYEKGQGVAQNSEHALYWYERAVHQGCNAAIGKVETLKKENVKAKVPFQRKNLDFNQTEVLKSIKMLMINDNPDDQIFTRKLESLIMERKFKVI